MNESHSQQEQALDLYRKAQELLCQGRILEGISLLNQALALDAGFLDARYELAKTQMLLGLYPEALDTLAPALKKNVDDPELARMAIDAALFDGDADKALQLAETFVEACPFHEEVALRFALLSYYQKNLAAACRAIARCLRKEPAWVTGCFFLGGLHEVNGNATEADIHFARYMELEKELNLSPLQVRNIWRQATPENNPLRLRLCELFMSELRRLSGHEPSLRKAERFLDWHRLFRNRNEFLEEAIIQLLALGERQKARELFARMPPDEMPLRIGLIHAEMLMESCEYAKALGMVSGLCERHPDEKGCWVLLGRLLCLVPRSLRNPELVQKALEHVEDNAGLWYLLAEILKEQGDSVSVANALEKCLQIDSGYPDAGLALGIEYLLLGRDAEACQRLSESATRSPENPEIWRHLALACTRLERWEEGLDAWRMTLSLLPTDEQSLHNAAIIEKMLSKTRTQGNNNQ